MAALRSKIRSARSLEPLDCSVGVKNSKPSVKMAILGETRMATMTRRSLGKMAGGATAASALSAFSAPAVFAASNMTKMRVGALPIVDFTPLYAAQANGYFAAQRLDVTFRPSPGGAPGFTALASGDLQACVASLVADLVVADRGLVFPLIACAAAIGEGPPNDEAALVIAKDSGMRDGKAWNHKRVGVSLLDSIAWLTTRMWVDKNGGDSSTISFVEIHYPQMNDALLNKRVDAIQQNEPFLSQLVQDNPDKVELVTWLFSAMLPNALISGLFANEDYISKNRAAVDAFNHAYNQGVDWVNGHLKTQELYQLISGYSKLPVARLEHLFGLPRFETRVSPAVFMQLGAAMKQYKMIAKLPDPKVLVFPPVLAG